MLSAVTLFWILHPNLKSRRDVANVLLFMDENVRERAACGRAAWRHQQVEGRVS
jgi:hypothetical protein